MPGQRAGLRRPVNMTPPPIRPGGRCTREPERHLPAGARPALPTGLFSPPCRRAGSARASWGGLGGRPMAPLSRRDLLAMTAAVSPARPQTPSLLNRPLSQLFLLPRTGNARSGGCPGPTALTHFVASAFRIAFSVADTHFRPPSTGPQRVVNRIATCSLAVSS